MAMQGAAPLVRAAFVSLAALYGTPSSPDRPGELTFREICPVSGQRPGPGCAARKRESFTPLAADIFDRAAPCPFHVPQRAGGQAGADGLAFPQALQPWARAHGLRDNRQGSTGHEGPLEIAFPTRGSVFQLDPHREPSAQLPPLVALPAAGVAFSIDGLPARVFEPTPGRHRLQARRGNEVAEAEIVFE
jgi:hypothetical protein